MGFREDLERWAAAEISRHGKLGENIRRLLRGADGGTLYPKDRPGLPAEILERRPGVSDFAAETIIPGSWIYYPVSDTAEYSWGDPYTTTLGTVLAGITCPNSSVKIHEKAKHPFRLYDGDEDLVTHGTTAMAGNHWWKYDDYVISWGAVLGHESLAPQFTDNQTRAVYRNGTVLAYSWQGGFDNPMEIKGAAIRDEGATKYLYISSSGLGTGSYVESYLLQRAVINPYGTEQEPSWSFSTSLAAILATLTPPFNTSNPLISSAFNKSCDRLLINQPGRVVEIDISIWGSESIVSDTYFGDSIDLGAEGVPAYTYGPASGEIPVISGFEPDSDVRRDLSVEIAHTGYVFAVPQVLCDVVPSTITATLKENETAINSWILHEHDFDNSAYGERAFITVNPYYQSVEGRVYCVDYHRIQRIEEEYSLGNPAEPWLTRNHRQEIYRKGELFYSRDLVENHPNPGDFTSTQWREFTYTGGDNSRDRATYPQCGISQFNYSYIVTINEETITDILGECIGFYQSLPSSNTHSVSGFFTHGDRTYDPTYGTLTFGGLNYVAFAADWNSSFILSRRVFNDWNAIRDPLYEWINTGTVDLLDKTGAVGDNQRIVIRGCAVVQNYLKNALQQIGVYHSSSAAPFS